MRTKVTAGILIAALAVVPYRPARAQQKPAVIVPLVCGCVVLGVGLYVAWKLVQLCKKLDDPHKDPQPGPPPGTNGPAPQVTKIRAFATQTAVSVAVGCLDDSGAAYSDISTNNYCDPVTGAAVTTYLEARLLTSADTVTWKEVYTINGWASSTGTQLLFSSNGVPVYTNYLWLNATNFVPLPIANGTEPAKFFRIAGP